MHRCFFAIAIVCSLRCCAFEPPFFETSVDDLPFLGRGCFLEFTEVTLADRTTKQLRHVVVGDEVLSWDEVAQQPVTSIVKHVPIFQREISQLVEICLPAGELYATEDHPIWSRGKQGLVSLHPNRTAAMYDLQADLMSMDEVFEDHDLQAVQVTVIRKPHASPRLRGRLLEVSGNSTHVNVVTLCLEPFHWYYAAGIRVHNKGCFIGSTDVSLADGTTKQLQHVQIGDAVLSWDEGLQQAAASVVVRIPAFKRAHEDMAEVVMPHGQLYMTNDHPVWSRGRQGLVSLRPDQTEKEYDLAANLMSADEELEGHDLQSVRVSAIQKPHASASLPGRLLESSGNKSHVDVMTLCLEPHHWYYAQGVRVHNKGCFAPWVRVTMPDQTSKAISDVRVDDVVMSWNSESGKASKSRVVEVYTFPAVDLMQLSLNHSFDSFHAGGNKSYAEGSSSSRRLADHPPQSSGSLVLTADHPVYSSRLGGPVSLRPERTHGFYGLRVGQLLESDVLQDLHGREVHAAVQPWLVDDVSTVMTLALDPHPWFYAEGVLVHNKHENGTGIMPRPWRDRKEFANEDAFAYFVIDHTRRRRQTFIDDDVDNCDMSEEFENGTEENITRLCLELFSGSDNETHTGLECDECTSDTCVNDIVNCSKFLYSVYVDCQGSRQLYFFWILLAVIGAILAGSAIYVLKFALGRQGRGQMMKTARQLRLGKAGANGRNLANLTLQGTMTEKGQTTKHACYTWSVDSRGMLDGSGPDEDGTACVSGVVCWRPGCATGEVLWGEQRPNCEIEAKGTITTAGTDVIVAATYFGFQGRRALRGTLSVSTAPTYELK